MAYGDFIVSYIYCPMHASNIFYSLRYHFLACCRKYARCTKYPLMSFSCNYWYKYIHAMQTKIDNFIVLLWIPDKLELNLLPSLQTYNDLIQQLSNFLLMDTLLFNLLSILSFLCR